MQEIFDKILKDAQFSIPSEKVTKELILTQDGDKNRQLIRDFDYGNGDLEGDLKNNYALWIENSNLLKPLGGTDPEVFINDKKYSLNFASTQRADSGVTQPNIMRIKGDSRIGFDSNLEYGRGPRELPLQPKSKNSEISWVLGV